MEDRASSVASSNTTWQIIKDIFVLLSGEVNRHLGVGDAISNTIVAVLTTLLIVSLSSYLLRPSIKHAKSSANITDGEEGDSTAGPGIVPTEPLRKLGGQFSRIRSRIMLSDDQILQPMSRAARRYENFTSKIDRTMYAARSRYHDLSSKFGVKAAVSKIKERRRYKEVTQSSKKGDGLKSIFASVPMPARSDVSVPLLSQSSSLFSQLELSDHRGDALMALHATEVLSWLPEDALRLLATNAVRIPLTRGEFLFQSGQDAETPSCFVIVSGTLRMSLGGILNKTGPSNSTAPSSASPATSGINTRTPLSTTPPASSGRTHAHTNARNAPHSTDGSEIEFGPGEMATGLSDMLATLTAKPIVTLTSAWAGEEDTVVLKLSKKNCFDALFATDPALEQQLLQRILMRINRVAFMTWLRLTGQLMVQEPDMRADAAESTATGPPMFGADFNSLSVRYLAGELGVDETAVQQRLSVNRWDWRSSDSADRTGGDRRGSRGGDDVGLGTWYQGADEDESPLKIRLGHTRSRSIESVSPHQQANLAQIVSKIESEKNLGSPLSIRASDDDHIAGAAASAATMDYPGSPSGQHIALPVKSKDKVRAQIVTLKHGENLMSISDEPALYIVLQGKLHVYLGQPGDTSGSTFVQCINRGSSVGHLSMITGSWNEWYAHRGMCGVDAGEKSPWVMAVTDADAPESHSPGRTLGSSRRASQQSRFSSRNSMRSTAENVVTLLRVPEDSYFSLVRQYPQIITRKATSLLEQLSPLVRLITTTTRWVYMRAGETLVKQGDPVDLLYVVLHGRMRASWAPGALDDKSRKVGSSLQRHLSSSSLPVVQTGARNNLSTASLSSSASVSPHTRLQTAGGTSVPRLPSSGWGWNYADADGEGSDEQNNPQAPGGATSEQHSERNQERSDSLPRSVDGGSTGGGGSDAAAAMPERVYGEYGKGAILGEDSFLTGRPMSVTLRAMRSTQLAALPKVVVQALMKTYPETLIELGKTLALRASRQLEEMRDHNGSGSRHHHTNHSMGSPYVAAGLAGGSGNSTSRTVAIIPSSPTVPLDLFAHTLGASLTAMGSSVQIVTSARAEKVAAKRINAMHATSGACQSESDAAIRDMLITVWLNELEEANEVVLYQADPWADPEPSWWTQLLVREADTVLLVANANDNPRSSDLEMKLNEHFSNARRELVMLHIITEEEGSRQALEPPKNTRKWIENRGNIHHHHHIRFYPYDKGPGGIGTYDVNHFKSDFRRLGRWLMGTSVGLVLGGGGARGTAHLGAIRALENEGIPIDFVAGTSIGAFMGGLYALKTDQLHMWPTMNRFTSDMASLWKKVRDVTFPITAYLTGKGFNRQIVKVFEDQLIEDLWLPYFCVSTDLTDSKEVVHRNGAMWRYVRASMTLTGYLPPVCDSVKDDVTGEEKVHYLVDGGYMNNLPVDVMRSLVGPRGTVIAVDVQADWTFAGDDYGDSLNGWWYLWSLINPWMTPKKIPSASDVQVQLAFISAVQQENNLQGPQSASVDLMIRPQVGHFGTLEFGRYREIEAIGYDKAVREVGKWMSSLRANTDNRLRQWATRRRNPKTSPGGGVRGSVGFTGRLGGGGGGSGDGMMQKRLVSGMHRPSAGPMLGGALRTPLSNSDRKKTAPSSLWKMVESESENA